MFSRKEKYTWFLTREEKTLSHIACEFVRFIMNPNCIFFQDLDQDQTSGY